MDGHTHTPLRSVWLVVGVCGGLLALVGLGSQQTMVAVFALTAPALDLSYVAVICARHWYAGEVSFVPGPFTLGRWRRPVNAVAVGWVLAISAVLFAPPVRPVDRYNMNYAVFVAAAVALFALAWWWLRASAVYAGPRTHDGGDCAVAPCPASGSGGRGPSGYGSFSPRGSGGDI